DLARPGEARQLAVALEEDERGADLPLARARLLVLAVDLLAAEELLGEADLRLEAGADDVLLHVRHALDGDVDAAGALGAMRGDDLLQERLVPLVDGRAHEPGVDQLAERAGAGVGGAALARPDVGRAALDALERRRCRAGAR